MEKELKSRRQFLKNTVLATGGLWVGLRLGGKHEGEALAQLVVPTANAEVANAWINVGTDGKVKFHLERVEMGQGVATALTTIVAEELNMPPEMVQFYLPFEGGMTGGSSSIRNDWAPLKRAAAAVREVLIQAAAQKWSVSEADVEIKDGELINRRNQAKVGLGDVVEAASRLRFPTNPKLKDPATYRFVGKMQPRLDNRVKVNGVAQYTIDVRLPGMVYATVKHCPWFDTTVRSFDASKIQGKPGILKVFKIPGAVVVVADSTWRAFQAIKQVDVTWGSGQPQGLMQEDLQRDLREALKGDGLVVANKGSMRTLEAVERRLDVTYEAPYVPHVTMEPQTCVAWMEPGRLQVWAPTQMPDSARETAADVAGLSSDQVSLYNPYLGGGFGRRLNQDYVEEAVAIAKEMMGTPVKMTWTREEDFQHDYYRPASSNRMQGSVDANGLAKHWFHKNAMPSVTSGMLSTVVKGTLPNWLPTKALGELGSRLIDKGLLTDPVSVEGARKIFYAPQNFRMEQVMVARSLPTGAWRSVGHSVNGFVAEGFADELAHLAGVDPYEFRLRNLQKDGATRNIAVLKLAAEKAGWGRPKPEGVFQGIAQHPSFGSYVATVVEVKKEAKALRILRVIYAVDCGQIVNPDIVQAQIEGGCIFALTAALKQEITVKNGAVEQENFHNSDLIRIYEAPPVEVYFANSGDSPGGVGEIGVPPLAPALANAIFAATGTRYRKMPMSLALA